MIIYFVSLMIMSSICASGETFGLAIAEFSVHNKPVLTSSVHISDGRAHLDILGKKGLYYKDEVYHTV